MAELTLKAALENIPEATAFIDEQLALAGCPVKTQYQIDIAMDEIFGNIARYAYAPDTGDATIRFDFDAETRTACITFLDRGVPFDPLKKEAPDVSAPAEERGIGGLGIYLVRKTMDRVEYRHENGMNILSVQKRI